MLNSFPVALIVGTVLGTLASLGVGGGSLLMLWLTLVLGQAYGQARILNLLFFLPGAAIATFVRCKKGSIPIKKLMLPILIGSISAALFSLLGQNIELTLIKKLFGGLLLFTGVRELLYRPRKPK